MIYSDVEGRPGFVASLVETILETCGTTVTSCAYVNDQQQRQNNSTANPSIILKSFLFSGMRIRGSSILHFGCSFTTFRGGFFFFFYMF